MAEDVFGIVGSTQAGSFQVERVVAEGGFGVVYRAQHGAFRAPVALKCLKVPSSMNEEQREAFLEKFRSEAELLFRLSASIPEVVRPLHVDVLHLPDGRFVPFLALEWLEGEALDAIISRRKAQGQAPIGLHKLVKMLRPIAQALSRAHRFPGPTGPTAIIHRDLKPDNIFVARINGVEVVKVLDFGIAKAKSAASAIAGRQTGEEALNAFTPQYAAPEQWLPKRYGTTGPWTDVWGLALTMVEALSGSAPIDGEVGAMMGTAIDEKRRPTPRAEGVIVSHEIDLVFERALAVDPRDRIKDVETFWTELELAMGSAPTLAPYDPRREDGPSSDAPQPRTKAPSSGAPAPLSGLEAVGDSEPARRPQVADTFPVPDPDPRLPAPGEPQSLALSPTVALGFRGDTPHPGPRIDHVPPEPAQSAAGGSVGTPHTPGSVGTPHTPGPSAPPRSGPYSIVGPRSRPGDAPHPGPLATDPPTSRPRSSLRVPDQLREASSQLAELGDLRVRLRVPLRLIGAALVITVVDMVVAKSSGGSLAIGPIRAYWIAVPLALAGVALAFWRIFMTEDD